MTLEQLAALCQEAARDLVGRTSPPYPATVVVPLPEATRVYALADFPDNDVTRFDLLSRFAADELVPRNAACFGFVAEGGLDDGTDVVVVVFGARRRGAHITAAPVESGGLGAFAEPEPLDPTALPFLRPLQHAVDAAPSGPPPHPGRGTRPG